MIEAIEEVSRSRFRNLVPQVISAAQAVLNDPKHKHHVPLIISLLGTMGYAEKAAVEVNVSGEIVVDHTAAAVEDLRRMKSLGFTREQLLETFGYSGLDRYEKMLAAEPKVIGAGSE